MNNKIQKNLEILHQKINNIAKYYNRKRKDISLVVVTKNQNIENIKKIIELKEKHLGENYVQEGIKKIQYFQKQIKQEQLIWHYIGSIQSNKTRYIAKYFNWCHTLENQNIAHKLNEQRPKTLPPLNVLIQININYENNKSGIFPNQLINLSKTIRLYSRLNLRGIMCIPKREIEFEKQLETFRNMRKLFQILQKNEKNIDTLSLGMSDDMRAAIASGSTLIRIGKAIFQTHKNKQ